MKIPENSYGYLRLDGGQMKSGKIDLAQASDFLKGLDNSLRFFIEKESPNYLKIDYHLEVKIEPGSFWVFLFGMLIVTPATVSASAAAKKITENTIGDKTVSDVYRGAVTKLRSTVQITKHLGGLDKKIVDGAKFSDDNKIIAIPNSSGEYLHVRRDEFEAFFATPKTLYERLVAIVDNDTSLTIGVKEEDGHINEEEINYNDRVLFIKDESIEEADDIILPELKDGEFVELEGELTRGNGRTNTFGFAYGGHIITCTLREGRVKDHKLELFGRVRVTGTVTRHYENEVSVEEKKKPKIIFDSIISLEDEDGQPKLL